MIARDMQSGRALYPSEAILDEWSPSLRAIVFELLPTRWIAVYFASCVALGGLRWARTAAVDALSGPLAMGLATLALTILWGALIARSTHYCITDRRIILRYGLAIPRTLSIPYSCVAALSVVLTYGGRGHIRLATKRDTPLSFVKLWPNVQGVPWRVPHVLLRDAPKAGLRATRLARRLQQAEIARNGVPEQTPRAVALVG